MFVLNQTADERCLVFDGETTDNELRDIVNRMSTLNSQLREQQEFLDKIFFASIFNALRIKWRGLFAWLLIALKWLLMIVIAISLCICILKACFNRIMSMQHVVTHKVAILQRGPREDPAETVQLLTEFVDPKSQGGV